VKIHKLAGIDIGSNSVRLLVSNVIEHNGQVNFKKSSLTRLPIRLGTEAFDTGSISDATQQRLIKGMKAYQNIMQVHGVQRYRACATSALREATNGLQVVEAVDKQTGVNIELISGKEEARMIFNTGFMENIKDVAETFLYIDVGGGSTELTLFHAGSILASRSFKIGTIRLLADKVKDKRWLEMESWTKEHTNQKSDILMVGSGGNINRTFKLVHKTKGESMNQKELKSIYQELKTFDNTERMLKYDLNPDRTDVITHALRIYTKTMKWSNANRIIVPKKGLADGIVRFLYREHFAEAGV
jgi:exopolyphosphatase/guanosine-5'-triphosphate,3'-diphosphate pyrophosphatase